MKHPTATHATQAPPQRGPTAQPPASNAFLDRFFQITERGSTLAREFRGGLVTFFTMAYIVILNPLILGGFSADNAPTDVAGGWLSAAQVGAVTGLTAGVMTILFGLIANLPFGLAAGLGINSFLAVSVIQEVTWAEAMGLVVINGILIVLFGVTGARTAIFRAVPKELKAAITVGIGLFIAFIGFVDSGFVRATAGGPPVQLGDNGSITSIPTLVFVVGLLVMGILVARKVQGGLLIGIVATTVLAAVVEAILKIGPASETNPGGWHLNTPVLSGQLVSAPDLGLVGQFDLFGAFGRIGGLAATMLVFTLVFTNFFDAMGTMTGLAKSAGVAHKDGTFPRLKSAFIVEGFGAVAGGATSGSSNTVYIDSAAGHRRRRPHGSGLGGHRRAVPGLHVPHPAHQRGAARGGRRGAGGGGRDDDGADPRDQVQQVRRGPAGLPDHRHHAAELLDRQRHRRGLRVLGRDRGGLRQGEEDPSADVGGHAPASWSTSPAARSARCWARNRPPDRPL